MYVGTRGIIIVRTPHDSRSLKIGKSGADAAADASKYNLTCIECKTNCSYCTFPKALLINPTKS